MNFKKLLIYKFIYFSLTTILYAEKISYLDIDFILNNSQNGKNIIQDLNELNSKNIDNLKIKEEKLQEEKNEINNQQNILSSEELNKKIKSYQNKYNLYLKEKDLMVKNLNNIKEKKLNTFISEISPIIEKFMKENSISILVDKNNIFIADPKYDITNDILELVNKNL